MFGIIIYTLERERDFDILIYTLEREREREREGGGEMFGIIRIPNIPLSFSLSLSLVREHAHPTLYIYAYLFLSLLPGDKFEQYICIGGILRACTLINVGN